MNFQIQETLKKLILFSDENLRLETIFYRIFVNFSDYFVTICCHLFEKGIMTEQFDTKRSRLIMGKSSLSSHNHVLRTWKQNMLYRATKVDFWQAIPPLWQPHQQHAATARFYFTKWSSRSYVQGASYVFGRFLKSGCGIEMSQATPTKFSMLFNHNYGKIFWKFGVHSFNFFLVHGPSWLRVFESIHK